MSIEVREVESGLVGKNEGSSGVVCGTDSTNAVVIDDYSVQHLIFQLL